MNLGKEFKEFAIRGNVIDLAVGVMIGSAFSAIVNSVVKDLIMPIVGLVTGGLDFSNLFVRLGPIPATFKGDAGSYHDLQAAGIAVLGYGSFITVAVHFMILAFIIFLMVKFINSLHHFTPPSSTPPEDVLLLREIRDQLKTSSTAHSSHKGASAAGLRRSSLDRTFAPLCWQGAPTQTVHQHSCIFPMPLPTLSAFQVRDKIGWPAHLRGECKLGTA